MHSTASRFAAVAFLLFTLALIAKASEMPLTEFYLNLFLGWGMFLRRVATQLSVNWSAVATGILCLVLIWIGLHLFLRWLTTAMRAGDNSAIPPSTTWKKRWTSSIVGVVLLMFVAGISFIGVVHQTSWLAASPEPYVEQRVAWFRGPSKDLLRGMGLATQNYHDIHQASPHHRLDKKGNHSWLTAILPFGRLTVDGINLDLDWDHPDNKPSFSRVLPTYLNPEIAPFRNADGYALSHYAGNVHVFGDEKIRNFANATDGQAHTLLAGEVTANFKPWGDPGNLRDVARGINNHPDNFGGPSRKGAWLLTMDGSVKFYNKDTSPAVFKALAHPRDGRVPHNQ